MNKTKIVFIAVLIAVAGGYYALTKTRQPAAVAPSATQEKTEAEKAVELQVVSEEGSEENVITYTDSGFSPKEMKIKAGETAVFKNESSKSMWPASAMHPTHAVYPTTGGCLGSTFDACKGLLPGESWSFKFDIAGNWKYHDHLTPTFFGAIDVK
jgi:plastocyanin